MSVMVNGYGSREKPKLAPKRVHHVHRQDENLMSVGTVVQSDEDIPDAKPLPVSSAGLPVVNPKRTTVRLDIFYNQKKKRNQTLITKFTYHEIHAFSCIHWPPVSYHSCITFY